MYPTKNLFLYQLLIIQLFYYSIPGGVHASSCTQAIWHPLQQAVYQVNLKEVKNLLAQKNDPQTSASFLNDTPIELAEQGCKNNFLHPTTRKTASEIYKILQKHEFKFDTATIYMQTNTEMWLQYRQAHAEKIDTAKKLTAIQEFEERQQLKKNKKRGDEEFNFY
jgi:hypothetical protein